MNHWQLQPITFRFQLSDWTLFRASLPMQARMEELSNEVEPAERPIPPELMAGEGGQGYCIRNLPIAVEQPVLTTTGNYLCYIPLQYPHCYIDLDWSFEQYVGKFSSKTRSTIQRKIRKYKEHCGGELKWATYSAPDDVAEFFKIARKVSELTYQERLLDVGLPNSETFIQKSLALAAEGRVRAYVLFHGERPVSYLYCPEKNGVLIYAYLGYDPEYQNLSVGTILQWLAIEQIFEERKFRFFDFTEGISSHKQLFASHQRLCANVFFVRRTFSNTLLIRSHLLMDRFSKWLGNTLERYGLKAKVKKLLRRS